MIFQRFKELILENKLQKQLAKVADYSTLSSKKIQSVGIITTEEISSKYNLKEEIEAVLGLRNVKVYSFRTYMKTDDFSYKHFTEKDINWQGIFKQPNFNSFLEQPLDLLIGYFNYSNLYLESAVLQSNAGLKVGFSGVNSKLYEIEITEKTSNLNAFAKELKKYLIILKKL